jgi:magnesium chelatase family protein
MRLYRARISGPFLDRIDLQVEVPAMGEADLMSAPPGEPSCAVRARVCEAHAVQLQRQDAANARLSPGEVERYAPIDAKGERELRNAIATWQLSARALQRVRKVARTIADLGGSEDVRADDVAEAIGYRAAWR